MDDNKQGLRAFPIAIAELVLIIICTACSGAISQSVITAEKRCLNMVIPSLFAVMVLSQLMLNSKAAQLLMLPFYPIYRFVVKLHPRAFFVFLMSCISGYPMGARLISDLFDRGEMDKRSAERMLCFCCCGGPTFYVGMIGLAVFGSARVGLLIFCSIIGANLLIAIPMSRGVRFNDAGSEKHNDHPDLATSVDNAGKSMFTICTMILLFSALLGASEQLGLFRFIETHAGLEEDQMLLLKGALELTSLTELSGIPYALLPFITGLCAFGGVCVQLQIKAVVGNRFSISESLAFRAISGAMSGVICHFLQPIFVSEALMASAGPEIFVKIDNLTSSICLISMIFLLNFKKSLVFSKGI